MRTVKSEYDTANRPMRVTQMNGNAHLYTGEVEYDEYNNLKVFKEKVGWGRTAYRTDFTYDKENKPTLLTYGDANNKVAYAYDVLGRVATRTVTVGGNASASTYSYVAGGHGTGSTTTLISAISPGNSENCAYTYDDVGNITAATRGTVTTTYAYDNLGQLTRVNDPSDTTSGSAGTTWTYEYDRGGNILNKKRYAYTTGTVGTVLQTISYGYDTTWKDKLTSYNGQSLTYDAIGNPLSDGTWNYTWTSGRQLRCIHKGEFGVAGYDENIYFYNSNGLRISKSRMYYDTAAGNIGYQDTEYTLHGKNIVHMTCDGNSLHFWYDAQNRPAIVDFNGTKYTYILNLQGDVVGLQNASGTEVVRYTYDAWGKKLATTGSLASTLGYLNPFRYRGYVYDEETGLYYLRSRYYNSTLGRFVNEDASIGKISLLFSHNLFCYCANRFIRMVDKDGDTYVDSLSEYFDKLEEYYVAVAGGDYIFASTFISNALARLNTPYSLCRCSTLIDSAAGQTTPSIGMSTMMREDSIICGEISEYISYDDLLPGTILCKLLTYKGKPYTGGAFNPENIVAGDVVHGGIFFRRILQR